MAHKVLSSDMADLISAMKLAQQFSSTHLEADYRKGMLKAAHALAMDSKNLLDSVDNARKLKVELQPGEDEEISLEQPVPPPVDDSELDDLKEDDIAEKSEGTEISETFPEDTNVAKDDNFKNNTDLKEAKDEQPEEVCFEESDQLVDPSETEFTEALVLENIPTLES